MLSVIVVFFSISGQTNKVAKEAANRWTGVYAFVLLNTASD